MNITKSKEKNVSRILAYEIKCDNVCKFIRFLLYVDSKALNLENMQLIYTKAYMLFLSKFQLS